MNKIQNIPIDKIHVGNRIRKDLGDLQLLSRSISRLGLLQPIVVQQEKNGTYKLLAGFRRLSAHKLLGLKKIVASIVGENNND